MQFPFVDNDVIYRAVGSRWAKPSDNYWARLGFVQAGKDAFLNDVMATDGANSWKPDRSVGWRHLVSLHAVLTSFLAEKHLSI